jgi:hypothetical protein
MSYEFKVFTCFDENDRKIFIKYINANELRKTSIVKLYNSWENKVWISIENIVTSYFKWGGLIFSLVLLNDQIVGIANNMFRTFETKRVNCIYNVRIDDDHKGKGLCEKIIINLINSILINTSLIYPIILEVLEDNIPAIKCYCKTNFDYINKPHHLIDGKYYKFMVIDKNLYIKNLIQKLGELSYNINFNISSNFKEHQNIKHIISNYLNNYLAHDAIKID